MKRDPTPSLLSNTLSQKLKATSRIIPCRDDRPETMLGDTAVAVNPNDKRWKPYIGKMVVLPLVGREIPIVADEHADPEQGSGAVKITPAHDFNDFEVGRRHNLPLINFSIRRPASGSREIRHSSNATLARKTGSSSGPRWHGPLRGTPNGGRTP